MYRNDAAADSELREDQQIGGERLNRSVQVAKAQDRHKKPQAAIRRGPQPIKIAMGGVIPHQDHDARTAIEMISAVFESQRLNSQRVTFPLKTRENPLSLL